MSHLFDASADGFRSHAVRGGVLTSVARALKLGISFASVIVLARLLRSRDFGIYAMAMPFVGVVLMVQDFGLSQALVMAGKVGSGTGCRRLLLQRRIVDRAGAGPDRPLPPARAFYGEPAIMAVTWGLAASVLFS